MLEFNYSYLPIPIAATGIAFALLGIGWYLILRMVHILIPLKKALPSWLVPNAGKYIPGKILMFGGRIEMVHMLGERRASATLALTLEHITLILAAFPFAAIATFQGLHIHSLPTTICIGIICGSCFTFALFPNLLILICNRFLALFHRDTLACNINRKYMLVIFCNYVIAWCFYGFAAYYTLLLLGIHEVPLLQSMTISIAAWLIGFLSLITPGGMGVREAVFVAFLSNYIDSAQAMACALLLRLIWTIIEWSGVFLGALIMAQTSHNNQPNKTQE